MGQTKTILVVDDIPLMRTMLIKYIKTLVLRSFREEFEPGQIELVEAANGGVAFELLKERSVDLIFLDLMMPEMDGLTFLALKRDDPELNQIPVIVCSALGEKETVDRACTLGARGYILKPFTLKSVEEKFREVFGILQT